MQKQVQPLLKHLAERFEHMDDGAGKLKARWPEIVGESLGKLCEPVRIIKVRSTAANPRGGVLEIRVAGAYAALIQHQSAVLLDRINLYLGGRQIERLKLVQGPLTVAPRMPPPRRPQPLSAAEEMGLRQSLADVEDEQLRKTLLSLGREVLKKEKGNRP